MISAALPSRPTLVGSVALRGLPGGGATELVAATLDEVLEGVMPVEMAAEPLHRRRGRTYRRRGNGRRVAHDGLAGQGPDLQADLAAAVHLDGEVVLRRARLVQECGHPRFIHRHLVDPGIAGEWQETVERWQAIHELPRPGQADQRDLRLGETAA